jgi:type II secretory pathway pseudopilin PulG
MMSILGGIGAQLLAGGAVIIGIIAAIFGVRASGARQANAERDIAAAKAREAANLEADKARKSAAAAPDDELDRRMRRWQR